MATLLLPAEGVSALYQVGAGAAEMRESLLCPHAVLRQVGVAVTIQ